MRSTKPALHLRPGETECPVCHFPAYPVPTDQDPYPERGTAYRHPDRAVLCRLTALHGETP